MYWPAMIEKSQYNEWRNHPCTLFFRRFLKDRRDQMIQKSTEGWLNGADGYNEFGRGYILALFDVSDVPFEFIENFYKERENEGEAIVNQESGIHTGAILRQK